MGLVSVKQSAILRATVISVKNAPKEIRADIRRQTKAVAAPQWTKALADEAGMIQQSRMIVQTARVNVSDQTIRVRAGGTKRKVLSGGATPIQNARGWEFGSKHSPHRGYPARRRRGYVFFPALAEMTPRIISLWVQTSFRVIYEAFEGKR